MRDFQINGIDRASISGVNHEVLRAIVIKRVKEKAAKLKRDSKYQERRNKIRRKTAMAIKNGGKLTTKGFLK